MIRTSLAALASVAALLGVCSCSSSDADLPSSGTVSQGGAGAAGTGGGAGAPTASGGGGATGGAGASGGAPAMGGAGAAAGGASNNAGAGGASGGTAGAAGANAASGSGGTSGAGPGGAGGSGGGSMAYNPCPTNGDACRVMPLGDSITDGCCGENTKSQGGSYRVELFHLSLANNKKLTFVGSHQSGPDKVDNVAFPKSQEGHSGWTIADGGGRSGLQQQIVGWLNATPPDIITLMIGTNDIDLSLDLGNATKRLSTLVTTITTTTPKALVVLAQVVPTKKDEENARDRTFNDALPALVKSFTDAGKHVVLVDMYSAYTANANFKTALLANDLHPSDAGYAVMANVWWAAIGDLLPAK